MELPTGIPPEARDLFARLVSEPLQPPEALRQQLSTHIAQIRTAAASNEFLDISLALRLATACNALLDHLEKTNAEPARRPVQAAVRYFILDDDGEHDLESVCGLDDDAGVCNAAARHIGRPDLVIEV